MKSRKSWDSSVAPEADYLYKTSHLVKYIHGLNFLHSFFFSFPDSKIFRETTCLRVSWSCLVTSYNCKQGSMETNLQQFSSLLFSNIKKIGHLAILKLLINRGLQHFNSWDQMGLFSWAKIKVRKTIQAKERSKREIQRV